MITKHETQYTKAEVEDMVRLAHVATFGPAPKGMQWESHFFYDGVTVEAVAMEVEPKQEVTNEAV